MSKKKRDERRREKHIERNRMNREAAANRRRRSASSSRKRTRISTPKTRATRTQKTRRTQTQRRTSAPRKTTQSSPRPAPVCDPHDEYSSKLSSMKTDLNSLSFRTRNLPERVNQLDNDINMIQSRIQKIRSSRYHSQKGLDKVSQDLARTWGNSSPSIRSYSQEQSSQLVRRQNSLEAQVDGAGSLSELLALGVLISDLTRDLGSAENSISGQLDDYRAQYQTLDRDLRVAEETVANLANTVIAWKNNEHPVLAVKVQDMTNDKQGVLTLTNLRILFEEVGEEVIRRNLLFATEKKTVREVLLDQPIGSIEVIEKGRVGFFKGAGLYIRFKPQTGLDELKIDTSGDEDDQIIHFYNYIVSGEAERELGPIEETQEDHVPVVCPTCSAPYQEEILRGQTSVKCIYCGSVIKV